MSCICYNVFIVKGDFRMGKKRNEEEYIGRENGKDIFRNEYGDYVRFVSTEEKDMESSILDGIDTNEDIEGMLKTLEEDWKSIEARVKALEKENTVLAKKLANKEKELMYFTDNNVTVKKFKVLENVKAKLEKQVEELKKENKILSMKRKASAAFERENELLQEIDLLKENNTMLQDYLEHSIDETDSLRNELHLLRDGYKRLYKAKTEHAAEYKNILEWIELLPREVDNLNSFVKRKGMASILEQESFKNIKDWIEFLQHEADKLREEDVELSEERDQLAETQCTPKRLEKLMRSKKILVMGGHVNWQNRIKEVYPKLIYLDSDNVNFDVSVLKNADYIFFNTLHCSHTLYFKVKENISVGRDKQEGKEKLVYINNNNVDVFTQVLMEKMLESE